MTNALFRKRRPNQKEAPPSENEAKGWLVEKITEWLNDFPWLRVEHDVMVRTTDDQDEAQVDVLLIPSGLECDRSKFVVIECKNEKGAIGIERIRAFADMLDDIGVPTNQGWYVSVTGFTKPAKRRARQRGIRLLELTGIEATKRLKAEVFKAYQSVVYSLLDFGTVFAVDTGEGPLEDVHEGMIFFDAQGHWKHALDFVTDAWEQGKIWPVLGTHIVAIHPPTHWFRSSPESSVRVLHREWWVKLPSTPPPGARDHAAIAVVR